jgi:OmpA-OmpF porin, OOP family
MKKNILASLVLSTLLASPAFAEGFYIGADVGQSKLSIDTAGFSLSKTATAFGAHAGYEFNPYIAAEIGYRNLGSVDLSNTAKLEGNALNLSAIAAYPFNDSVKAFARLGFGKVNHKFTDNRRFSSYNEDTSETKALFGAGAEYSFNKNFSLRGEYSQYAKFEDITISNLTVGVNYKF